jgi:hypothetical protein
MDKKLVPHDGKTKIKEGTLGHILAILLRGFISSYYFAVEPIPHATFDESYIKNKHACGFKIVTDQVEDSSMFLPWRPQTRTITRLCPVELVDPVETALFFSRLYSSDARRAPASTVEFLPRVSDYKGKKKVTHKRSHDEEEKEDMDDIIPSPFFSSSSSSTKKAKIID